MADLLEAPVHTGVSTATPQPPVGPAPKWAAVVDDTLIPLPRRKLTARVVLSQSGINGRILVRDYNQAIDVALNPDDELDLARGNVFRTITPCDPPPHGPPTTPAKLAFVIDDEWEVTVNPHQDLDSLRGLFGLPTDARLLRDYESPNDEPILAGVPVNFADGPVLRSIVKRITAKVNNTEVAFTERRQTALTIKKAAIAQGVAIELGFVTYRVKPDGGLGPALADDEQVVLKCDDAFMCIAPDDNS